MELLHVMIKFASQYSSSFCPSALLSFSSSSYNPEVLEFTKDYLLTGSTFLVSGIRKTQKLHFEEKENPSSIFLDGFLFTNQMHGHGLFHVRYTKTWPQGLCQVLPFRGDVSGPSVALSFLSVPKAFNLQVCLGVPFLCS